MIKLLSLLFVFIVLVPRPIPSVQVGITFYGAPAGKSLACNGHRYDDHKEWVALPTEWFLSGLVNCGDYVYAKLANGYTLDGVPAYDSGCLLHWSVFNSNVPFAVDVPFHMRWLYGDFNTQIINLRVYSNERNEWITNFTGLAIDNFSLAAWDNIHCDGPLTLGDEIWLTQAN